MKHRLLGLSVLLTLCPAAVAQAQSAASAQQPTHWGIIGSVAPWTAGNGFGVFYDAHALDVSGQEIRFGLAHGATRRGEFAFLYVNKKIDEGGTIVDLT